MAHKFSFYALSPEALDVTGVPPVPLPVRRSRAKRLLQGRTVPLEEILGELNLYLDEHPDEWDRYREATVLYAQVFGVALGRAGQLEAARRCFDIGLALRPDHAGLRAHNAVALHGLGHLEESLGEYRRLVDDPSVAVDPLIWILAARAHAEHGDHARALRLLRECGPLVVADSGVARLVADLEDAPAASSKLRQCTECRQEIRPGHKFCTRCSHPVAP